MTAQPRNWCLPKESFGQRNPEARVWQPPDPHGDPVAVSKFRAAVMQNAICVSVRSHKELHGIAQETLARRDARSDAAKMWNARLCGRANLTAQDMATLMMILPGVMPHEDVVRRLIDVAEGTIEPPKFWIFPDSSARRPPTV